MINLSDNESHFHKRLRNDKGGNKVYERFEKSGRGMRMLVVHGTDIRLCGSEQNSRERRRSVAFCDSWRSFRHEGGRRADANGERRQRGRGCDPRQSAAYRRYIRFHGGASGARFPARSDGKYRYGQPGRGDADSEAEAAGWRKHSGMVSDGSERGGDFASEAGFNIGRSDAGRHLRAIDENRANR